MRHVGVGPAATSHQPPASVRQRSLGLRVQLPQQALAGVFHSMYSAYQASLMQLKAEPRYRGRVLALQTTMWGTTPFAAVIMGRMIDYWSAAPVVGLWMASAAGLCVLVAIFARSAHEV